jgi:hypothetical protein
MTTLREAVITIWWILVLLCCVVGIVVGLSAVMPPREVRLSQTEVDFHSACAAVKGRAVWNGRHWECLK